MLQQIVLLFNTEEVSSLLPHQVTRCGYFASHMPRTVDLVLLVLV
jgi:hypothetical protein